MPSGGPCPPVAPPTVTQKQKFQTPVVTGADIADDVVVLRTELENAELATEMACQYS